jgi:hypothetical protein
MREKFSVTKIIASRYKKASKKDKKTILDEFINLTSYNRSYASHLLSCFDKQLLFDKDRFHTDLHNRNPRGKPPIYNDPNLKSALKSIWIIMDCICGKRLVPLLEEVISRLEFHREIFLDDNTRRMLLKISPATIDRLLAEERKKLNGSIKSKTRPGSLLKSQIPIRTFSEWNEACPGFVEIDLVAHEGGIGSGDFLQTLDVTDVCTGWTEIQAVKNKAQIWVFEALKEIRARLPFELLGIDSDNGGEFINNQLLRYCQEQKITFTRSRAIRKNDNCYVEQKNYSVVRRAVGYLRYDSEKELKMLNELYGHLRLYVNYFQPVMKLVEKKREGSKVKRKYDKAQTPYKRVMERSEISKEKKAKMRKEYERLNPAKLKREITRIQNELIEEGKKKEKKEKTDDKKRVCAKAVGGKK